MQKKDIDKALSQIVILVDSREQKWQHIKKYFDNNNITYEVVALKFGDYSFKVKGNDDVGEVGFQDKIAIERKASLTEISGNFSQGRDRFKREFEKGRDKIRLLIEEGSYKDITNNNYRTKLSPESFKASLHSFFEEFGVPFIFLDKESSGEYIYKTFYYYLRNILKNI